MTLLRSWWFRGIAISLVAIMVAVTLVGLSFRVSVKSGRGFVSIGIQNTVYAQELGEVVGQRTQSSKTYYLGDNKYALDSFIGAIHYKDEVAQWQDIDTNFSEADTGGFTAKFTKLPYVVRLKNDSTRRIYPDRNDLSYWIELGKPFANMGNPVKVGATWTWDFPNSTVKITVSNTVLKFDAVLKNPSAPTSLVFPLSVQGIIRQGNLLLHNGQVVAELRKPLAIDSVGTERELSVMWTVNRVTLSLDTTGLVFPIDIDPTVDVQVGIGGNDGAYWYTGIGAFSATNQFITLGINLQNSTYHGFFRWVGVTLEGTINVSYIELFSYAQTGTDQQLKVYGVDEDNPAAPTSAAEYLADPLTTAAVDWDGAFNDEAWNTSPSLNGIFQELVDSYTVSNDAVMVQVKNDRAADSTSNLNNVRSYEYDDNTKGAKLHIEYTAGGEPNISVSPTSYNFGVVQAGSSTNTTTSYFTITNNSTMQTDQTISVTTATWSGGAGWTHNDSGTPGDNATAILANRGGTWGTGDVIVKNATPNFIYENLPASTNYSFGLGLWTPLTFYDGAEKTITVRVSAVSG